MPGLGDASSPSSASARTRGSSRRRFEPRRRSPSVSSWLARPAVSVLEAGEECWEILRELLVEAQVTGPLVMDAFLAALALENGATLVTTDRDFARFPKLKVENPAAG